MDRWTNIQPHKFAVVSEAYSTNPFPDRFHNSRKILQKMTQLRTLEYHMEIPSMARDGKQELFDAFVNLSTLTSLKVRTKAFSTSEAWKLFDLLPELRVLDVDGQTKPCELDLPLESIPSPERIFYVKGAANLKPTQITAQNWLSRFSPERTRIFHFPYVEWSDFGLLVEQLPKYTNLTSVSILSGPLSQRHVDLAEAFFAGLPPSLHFLNLAATDEDVHNDDGLYRRADALMNHLSRLTCLQRLEVEQWKFRHTHLQQFEASLPFLFDLQCLNMMFTTVPEVDATFQFFRALSALPVLRHLNLNNMNYEHPFHADRMIELYQALLNLPHLEVLHSPINMVVDIGDHLPVNTKVTSLRTLEWDPLVTYFTQIQALELEEVNGTRLENIFEWLAENAPHLTSLNLHSDVPLPDELDLIFDRLSELRLWNTDYDMTEYLRRLPKYTSLTKLQLTDGRFCSSEEECDAIVYALPRCNLTHLWMRLQYEPLEELDPHNRQSFKFWMSALERSKLEFWQYLEYMELYLPIRNNYLKSASCTLVSLAAYHDTSSYLMQPHTSEPYIHTFEPEQV